MVAFEAYFDGKHLCPQEPVVLPVNVKLRVVVENAAPAKEVVVPTEEIPAASNSKSSWLSEIESKYGLIDGPPDLAAELDHYLYGTPKRGDQGSV